MHTTRVDLTFPHQYEIELEVDLSTEKIKRCYYYPEAVKEGRRDGFIVSVNPLKSSSWIGIFAPGYPKALTGVFSCPDEQSVCVVASGQAYFVQVYNPQIWEQVQAFPIWDIRVILEKQLLVLADFTVLTAYGPHGIVWVTDRLSWDGIKITDVTSDWIRGLAWDSPQEKNVEFIVDLRTGDHKGGSSP